MLLPRRCPLRVFVLVGLAAVSLGLARGARAADPILDWNAIMMDADAFDHGQNNKQQPGPVLCGRAFAIASAAMYDALNSIEKMGAPYMTVAPDADGASVDAAVAQAAHDALVALYSAQAATFDAALNETLSRIPDGPSKIQGIAVGQFVASRILEARAKD